MPNMGSGAVDQKALTKVMTDNLPPESLVAVIALLSTYNSHKNGDPINAQALQGVEWLHNTLLDMVGVEQYDKIVDKIGL